MNDLESTLNYLLQRDLNFIIDGKVVKRGKLILLSIQDYYITFYLKHNNEQKKYELPYPFKFNMHKHQLTFDYTLNTLAHNNDELLFKVRSLTKKKNCKIFDNQVIIENLSRD